MTMTQIIRLEPGDEISAFNNPFDCAGKVTLTLESGEINYWIINEDEGMLAVAPKEEEIILYAKIEEDIEPHDDVILYSSKEYEYSYEDKGKADIVSGEVVAEIDDHFSFMDYESSDGEKLRIITNENTGLREAYLGTLVSEEEITEV